jgi:hypothetical protein
MSSGVKTAAMCDYLKLIQSLNIVHQEGVQRARGRQPRRPRREQ